MSGFAVTIQGSASLFQRNVVLVPPAKHSSQAVECMAADIDGQFLG
jgi:hypothetical protein